MGEAVLVTGASTGLGLATTLHLARQGYNVYAGLRDLAQRATLEEVAHSGGVQVTPVHLDLADRASIVEAVDSIVAGGGGLYGLVNNAGIGLRGYFEDLTEEEIAAVYDVNVLGTMALTKAVLPHMRAARRGRIIIVTSVAGRIASMGLTAYCSSKFAQEGFGESLAQEVLPFGIYVTLVEPAIIKTERWGANRGSAKGALNPSSPYYRWFKASEAAADRLVASSPTRPEDVAVRIEKVLADPHPRLRYVVGRRAAAAVALRRLLPSSWFERLYFGEAIRRVTKAA